MHNLVLFVQILFVVTSITCSSVNECDKHGILIYEDLACTPEYSTGNKDCPVKYTCKSMERSTDHCYFRGKTYTKQEVVDSNLTSTSCDIGCYCSPVGDISRFMCAIMDCPEWLGTPIADACYRTYSVDKCCSTGQVCPPFDTTEKCVVEGKEYRVGEKFYPTNTCLNCVCQKGFEGKFEEPFCKRRACGQQLRHYGQSIQASCAAFYTKLNDEILCCPDDWICPDGTEDFKGDVKSEESCRFGDKAVKVGQYFEKANHEDRYGRSFKKVTCECVIPPFMKCNTVIVNRTF